MATAQNNRVGYLTLEKILPKVVDTANKSSWILNRKFSQPTPWNGRLVQQVININNSSLGGSFKGVETFSTSIDFAPVVMTWYSTGYAQPVTISTVERGINQTPLGVINLYKASFEYAQNSMANSLGGILYGFGTGNDFDGLGLIIDDSTSTTTYAGLARATYGNYINCGGSTGIEAASSGVLDLATMAAADDAATVSGLDSETPNVIISNRTVWSLYETLLEPTKLAMYATLGQPQIDSESAVGQTVRPADGLRGRGGFASLDFRGKPYVRDDKATSGVQFFVNETLLEMHSLTLPGLSSVRVANQVTEGVFDKVPPTAFQWRDLMSPVNQLAEVGIFVVYGNMIHRNPIRNEKITGITTT
jgi:hypothetical protein